MTDNLDAAAFAGVDIYLIDQILKGRYQVGDVLLDAGCGTGRNLSPFLKSKMAIFGIDSNVDVIENLKKENNTEPESRFQVSAVENLSFSNQYFDGIICSAVLHFAHSTQHFFSMMDELYRVLKTGGTLFIRMASDIGLENRVHHIADGVYFIPDGSTRFLLTRFLLDELINRYHFLFLEDFKTVNVNDRRCMSTLLLQKVR